MSNYIQLSLFNGDGPAKKKRRSKIEYKYQRCNQEECTKSVKLKKINGIFSGKRTCKECRRSQKWKFAECYGT